MSIVAMKRKSRGYNNPVSGQGTQGFSLNGGYRNQGWVGQTSISRPVHRTLFKGTNPVGHGGHSGEYNVSVQSGSMCSANDSNIIKRSTLTTKGHIDSTVTHPTTLYNTTCIDGTCHQDTVKYIDPLQSSQEIYIKNLSDKTATCVVEKTTSGVYNCPIENKNAASHFIGGKKIVVTPYSKNVSSLTYGEYIRSLLFKKKCLSEPSKVQSNSC
jgi:hypothetical protein